MSDIAYAAEKQLSAYADDAAVQFDATLLHNRVHETVSGEYSTDDPLAAVLDGAERAYAIAERDDVGDAVQDAAFDAAERLTDQTSTVVDEQVARACATIVQKADDWTDAWGEDAVMAAKHEARDWLQAHVEAAERAGVLEEVRQ